MTNILTLDLHGHTVDVALAELDGFIHRAYHQGAAFVEIIHGKGEGILRAEVRHAVASGLYRTMIRQVEYGEKAGLYGDSGITRIALSRRVIQRTEIHRKIVRKPALEIMHASIIADQKVKENVAVKKEKGRQRYQRRMQGTKKRSN